MTSWNRKRLGGALKKGSLLTSLALAAALAGCSTELYSNLSEREANQMVQVLSRDGIEANRTATADGKYSVSVASSDFSLAVANSLPQACRARISARLGRCSTPTSWSRPRSRSARASCMRSTRNWRPA